MADKAGSRTASKPSIRTDKARGGRPTRAEALRRRIEAVGVSPDSVDPLRVLAGIAIDETASAAARVSACRVLLAHSASFIPVPPPLVDDEEDPPPRDMLTERALALLAGRGGVQ
jgi:hypothetical protein